MKIEAMRPISSFEKDFCGDYILNQACAILNYKKQAEAEWLATIPWCKFKDIKWQLQYVLSGGNNDEKEPWFGDWLARKKNYQNYSSLSFGDTSYIISAWVPWCYSWRQEIQDRLCKGISILKTDAGFWPGLWKFKVWGSIIQWWRVSISKMEALLNKKMVAKDCQG